MSTALNAFAITVGGQLCAPISLYVAQNPNAYVSCSIPELVAGPQELVVRVDDAGGLGYALISPDLVPVSFVTGQPTVFTQHAVVTGLSTQSSGLLGGATLTVTGSGFDAQPSNNVVLAAGSPCVVVSSSLRQLSCILGPGSPTTQIFNTTTGVPLPVFSGGRGVTVEVGGCDTALPMKVDAVDVSVSPSGIVDAQAVQDVADVVFSVVGKPTGGVSGPGPHQRHCRYYWRRRLGWPRSVQRAFVLCRQIHRLLRAASHRQLLVLSGV